MYPFAEIFLEFICWRLVVFLEVPKPQLTKLEIVAVPALLSLEMNIPSSTLLVLNKSIACHWRVHLETAVSILLFGEGLYDIESCLGYFRGLDFCQQLIQSL